MLKKLIATVTSAAMLTVSLAPAVMAEEPSVYDNVISTAELGTDKPDDYGQVLFSEDFNGDETFDAASFELVDDTTKATVTIESGDNEVTNGQDKGDYANFSTTGSTSANHFFRMKYGSEEAPIQKSGVAKDKLSKVQISLDVCMKQTNAQFELRFFDKWTNSGSTKAESLITMGNDGKIAFNDSEKQIPYNANEWMRFDIFIENGKYSAYINGTEAVKDCSTGNLGPLVESVGYKAHTVSDDHAVYTDNVRYAIPGTPGTPGTPEKPETPEDSYTNLNPELTDPKPYDYNRVIFERDFDTESAVDYTVFDTNKKTYNSISSNSEGTASAKDQGKFIAFDVKDFTDSQPFRMIVGKDTAPIQATGVKIQDLGKMQISFDICTRTLNRKFHIEFNDKWTDPSTRKHDELLSFIDGTITFANSDVTMRYVADEWMSFDVFFDFSTDTYSVYLNGNAVVKNVATTALKDCVESLGVLMHRPGTGEPTTYSIYLDNVRFALPNAFDLASSSIKDGQENVNVFEPVEIELTNNISNFKKTNVAVTCNSSALTEGFDVSAKDSKIFVSFPEGMQFGSSYAITVKGDIADIYGKALGADKTISFTTMAPEITSSVPAVDAAAKKVSVSVSNPVAEKTDAVLVVTVASKDGSVKLYSQPKEIFKNKTESICAAYEAAEGDTVTAFVVDSLTSLTPIRDIFVTADGEFTSEGSSKADAVLEPVSNVDGLITVNGSISQKESQVVIIKVADGSGKTVMAIPATTDNNGKFTCVYTIKDVAEGEYFVTVCGANIAKSTPESYIILSEGTKETIKGKINKATGATGVKSVFGEYNYLMKLPEDLLTDNVCATLAEQAPYDSYKEVIDMVYTADTLFKELNAADWSTYTSLFDAEHKDDSGDVRLGSDILLKGALKLDDYNDYTENQKNAINMILAYDSPFADFADLRKDFDAAVEEYEDDTSGSDEGGRDKRPNGIAPSYSVSSQDNAPQNLFADMNSASWAKAHVNVLYGMGIVSGAANYRPLDNVTREEFVKMLVQLAGLTVEGTPDFADVKGNEWFAPYLAAAQKAGIVKGNDNKRFGVGNNITRQDMVVMAQRTVSVMNKNVKKSVENVDFADYTNISDYAVSAVSQMQQAGVVSGMGNGRFEPLGLANRAQAAVVVCNLINAME